MVESTLVKLRETWKLRVAGELNALLEEAGQERSIEAPSVAAEVPPRPEMGDFGFPMFAYAKLFRRGPPEIARTLAGRLAAAEAGRGLSAWGAVSAEGPYVNITADRGRAARAMLAEALDETREPGRPGTLEGSRIMVEFSSPNTNKPLHLGHLRNDILGESVSRILAACGAALRKVCIINDRGIHICKSMLAYRELGQGKTPESEGVKSDHFVGNWYVAYNDMVKTDKEAEGRAREMLRKWEAGDPETVELWKLMNGWTVEGMKATYERTGVSFDQYYFESQTYLRGREEILKGLERGIFYRAEDGSVWVDLEAEKLDKKVLLRKDGTSLYITQDIGTAIFRHEDWPFDGLIFVVGSEQQYHFKVLFTVLDKLGFGWAKKLYHLSYGMVNLPEGKMKSREGTVVDADDLIDSLRDMALEEIREKDREEAVGDPLLTAEKVALGALHYYLLSVSPSKDMLFDPGESLSFNGNTGPYLQYMGARISALLRRAGPLKSVGGAPGTSGGEGPGPSGGEGAAGPDTSPLTSDPEWELLKILSGYGEAVAAAAAEKDPSLIGAYLYNLSKAFSRFYHDCPVLTAETPELLSERLALCRAVLRVLSDAMNLICIPFLETM